MPFRRVARTPSRPGRTCARARGGAGAGPEPRRAGRGRPPTSRPRCAARRPGRRARPWRPAPCGRARRAGPGRPAPPTPRPAGPPHRPLPARRPTPVGADQRDQGLGRSRTVGRGLGQPVLLGLEVRILVGSGEPGAVDLAHLVGQQLGLAGAGGGVAAQSFRLAQQGRQPRPGPPRAVRCPRPRRRRAPVVGRRGRPGSGAGAGRGAPRGRRRPRPGRRPGVPGRRPTPSTGPRGRPSGRGRPRRRRRRRRTVPRRRPRRRRRAPPSGRPDRRAGGSGRPPGGSCRRPSPRSARSSPARVRRSRRRSRRGRGRAARPAGRPMRDPYRSARWNFARRMAWKSREPNVTRRAGRSPSRQSTVAPGSRVAHGDPVDHQDGRTGSEHLQVDTLGGVEDEWSVEEHVGRDRGEDDGPQPGRQERAAGRQVVGGRAGGRRHQQSVGGVGHERPVVDGGGHADRVARHGLLDRRLVQGVDGGQWRRRRGRARRPPASSAPRPRSGRRGSGRAASSSPAGSISVR